MDIGCDDKRLIRMSLVSTGAPSKYNFHTPAIEINKREILQWLVAVTNYYATKRYENKNTSSHLDQ